MDRCEKCVHYCVCMVNSYCHEHCGYYEPARPVGEWIKIPMYSYCHYPCDGCVRDKSYADEECLSCEFWKNDDFEYKCNQCGKTYRIKYNFCPNCGADMRKEGEAE